MNSLHGQLLLSVVLRHTYCHVASLAGTDDTIDPLEGDMRIKRVLVGLVTTMVTAGALAAGAMAGSASVVYHDLFHQAISAVSGVYHDL